MTLVFFVSWGLKRLSLPLPFAILLRIGWRLSEGTGALSAERGPARPPGVEMNLSNMEPPSCRDLLSRAAGRPGLAVRNARLEPASRVRL